MAGDKWPHFTCSLENGGQGFFLVVVVVVANVVCGCEHEGVPVMLNLILLQTKESLTNDFVSVPNEKKVTSLFFLFCFVFVHFKKLQFQIEPNILDAS